MASIFLPKASRPVDSLPTMDVYYQDGPPSRQIDRPVCAIGTFDGMHRGHRALLRQLVKDAQAWGGNPGVITFRIPPRRFFAQKRHPVSELASLPPVELITTLEHRLLLFQRYGMKWAWVLDFDEEIARIGAREFVQKFLVERLRVIGVVIGFDNRFGAEGAGDAAAMEAFGKEFGFKTRIAPKFELDGEKISSSAIREAIRAGDFQTAQRMLGRPVALYGRIVHGDARGRKIGFPTANVEMTNEVQPPPGVYATVTLIEGVARLNSITNIGHRPTFFGENSDLKSIVETHLLDFSGDLYGTCVEIQFVQRIRGEKRFETTEKLIAQIQNDILRAREILGE